MKSKRRLIGGLHPVRPFVYGVVIALTGLTIIAVIGVYLTANRRAREAADAYGAVRRLEDCSQAFMFSDDMFPGETWVDDIAESFLGGRPYFPYSIELIGGSIDAEDARLVEQIPELRNLYVDRLKGASYLVARLPAAKLLSRLQVTRSDLDSQSIQHICRIEALQWLSISDTDFDVSASQELYRLGRLEVLLISDSKVTDAALQAMGKLPRLQSLRLISSEMHAETLRVLAGCPTLEVLEIGEIDLRSSATIQAISTLQQLKELRVSTADLDAHELELLEQALPGCRVVDTKWDETDIPKLEPLR